MPKIISRPRITAGLLIFLSAFIVYSMSLNSVWATDHTTSFLQLDWAILVHHSFVLGSGSSFHPNTVDDFEFDGNYYSALAPGTAILALPFVGVGFLLDGHFTVFGYALILSELFVALINAIAAYLVYAVGRFFFSKKTSAFLAFAYAFATISWPFATYFFQSDVSAMFDLLAVYFVIRVTRSDDGKLRDAVPAGIAVAGGLTTDYVNVIFIPIIMGYLLFSLRRKGRLARLSLGFLLASLVGVLLIGLYNEAIFGTAFHTTEQVYLNSSTPLGEFSYPIYEGVYLNLISPLRGLLVFSIFLILGIFGYVDMLRQRRYRAKAFLLLACFLGVFLPYSAWYDPTGGAAFGPRFLVSAIPFLLLPAGLVIETGSRRMRVTAFILYAVGVVINGMAGITSALAPTQNYGTFPFLSSTLPSFLSGDIDVWWLSFVHTYWPIPAVLLIALTLMLPLISNHLLSGRGAQMGTSPEISTALDASDPA
ncbi:MAG: glycosyltransferase family 39 protein [Thaumarchaeota archaeon]|nr:glycosyltransferase family 39 protein [Nitrososphaerota archaeon]